MTEQTTGQDFDAWMREQRPEELRAVLDLLQRECEIVIQVLQSSGATSLDELPGWHEMETGHDRGDGSTYIATLVEVYPEYSNDEITRLVLERCEALA